MQIEGTHVSHFPLVSAIGHHHVDTYNVYVAETSANHQIT